MTALLEAEEICTTYREPATTAELVAAAQMGDREAFGELFERYEHTVYNVAMRRLNDHAEAQELAQEVFVQALTKIDQIRTPEAFAGWIVSITHRMAINRAVRRRPVTAAENDTIESVFVETRTPQLVAEEHERARQVRAGLARLGKLDRDTLVAFYVDGRSLIEMSGDFHSPVGTIKRRLHVARKRLKEQLELTEEIAV
jgi:RNA polymerase sigma-70 factor (ECF subfamily)